ncbi:MAG: UDP-2,3-diacylglucosamine diphosphatase LpxI [Planctomycetota bacterium]|jgi:UDP-2,3-diacylglucosamine hydrolase|nr:UDP-2,3-diacylglucosamine diphosphatase LpxI [Planctomycetota bacterium]MDA1026118.1 UDP-2,3-diacylglucosamine diphosphatase LpxI [Planctomycetota bacterium]
MPATAIIAGQGDLPRLTAIGARAAGRRVIGLGLRGMYDDAFPDACDEFRSVSFLRPTGWARAARRAGCEDAILIGRVGKNVMHRRRFKFEMLQKIPDFYVFDLWYRRLRFDRRSATLLRILADDLAERGLNLVDSTTYLQDHLATVGVNTSRQPTAAEIGDVIFGWSLLKKASELDIGQAIAVRQRDVISVEALEGTDAMIARTGTLCPRGGWTLLKTSSPNHDTRSDVPTIGEITIRNAALAGCSCIAVGAGQVILADRPKVLAAADAAGIAIVGIDGDAAASLSSMSKSESPDG